MTDRAERLRTRLLATFRVEATDHMAAISTELEALAGESVPPGGANEHVDALFRAMHTLKGAARSVGFMSVESICQECESLLRDISRGSRSLDKESVRRLQQESDRMRQLLSQDAADDPATSPGGQPRPDEPAPSVAEQRREQHGAEPELHAVQPKPAYRQSAPPSRSAIAETIRVEVARIDRLVIHTEDLLPPKLALAERVAELKQITERVDVVRSRFSGLGQRITAPLSSEFTEHIDALRHDLRQVVRRLDADSRAIRTSVDDLFDELRRVRMMPAGTVLEAFPAMVRDLAGELGKDVNWHSAGTDLEIDRKVLEFIKDPLIHLVRNAVDHGIETRNLRASAGKPSTARVGVTFQRLDGGRVAVRVEDDGGGIDVGKVKEAAVRLRVVEAARAQAMSEEEVRELVFRSGLSTRSVITALSGHGLGLSVVREKVERLGGRILVESTPGAGTVVTLDVPESIATFQGLLIGAGGRTFLCSDDAVVRVVRLSEEEEAAALRDRFVVSKGETFPFARLNDVMGLPDDRRSEGDTGVPCIVLSNGGQTGAFAVEGVEGFQEVLVKEFQWPIVRARGISAVGLLGTGDLTLILRVSDLLQSMRGASAGGEKARRADRAERRTRVLVVDDSITTRTMERHMFEAAGFAVKVAADGIDAWNVLNTEDIDIVVTDIDMPRMNGFELTERVRGDARFAELPVILVTALESRDDKEKGLRLGANAYVEKSTFEQSNLLDIVRRLL